MCVVVMGGEQKKERFSGSGMNERGDAQMFLFFLLPSLHGERKKGGRAPVLAQRCGELQWGRWKRMGIKTLVCKHVELGMGCEEEGEKEKRAFFLNLPPAGALP